MVELLNSGTQHKLAHHGALHGVVQHHILSGQLQQHWVVEELVNGDIFRQSFPSPGLHHELSSLHLILILITLINKY